MIRGLLSATAVAVLSFATAAHAEDDLWRSQLEVGSFDVFHKADSASFDLQLRPGWRLWYFGAFLGGMVTTKDALMGYGGFTFDLPVTDHFFIVADASVGYYSRGTDKRLALGDPAEYRLGGGVAYEFDNGWRLGAVLHHISNNGADKFNPGVEVAALTLSIPLFGKPAPVAETPAVAPPPPAPPPPVAAKNYLVFFNFNKSDLTGEARAIIKTALHR
jgi:hypothetical protein